MIDFLEIRNTDREIIGIIDDASSIIWHGVYFGVGDFEIYAQLTEQHLDLLQKDFYVTRQDTDEVGIIEDIKYTFSLNDGYMITATGRFAKSILDRRIIYQLSGNSNTPTILRGNVEIAVRQVVKDNIIDCSFNSRRNVSFFGLAGLKNYPDIIRDSNGNAAQKQVSYDNLMEYTDSVLQEYGMASKVIYNDSNKKLLYAVYRGSDRSSDNEDGNDPIVFSTDFDNLLSSVYTYSEKTHRNEALIGGSGEGSERFYSLLESNLSGLQVKEIFVNASSQDREIKASELQKAYPAGTFSGLDFVVGGVTYATLVCDLEREYSLSTLQSKFPTGTVSGTSFVVGGVTYAIAVYGKENTYTLTQLGYKAMIDVDDTDGNYEYTASIYTSILLQEGQKKLKDTIIQEDFEGDVSATGQWIYGTDYFLGDIVTVQDNKINKYINTRVTEATEVQDENGYTVNIKFEK